MMFLLDYSNLDFKIKKEKEQTFIFDTIRKKWILLTPEEWVRQNIVQYLIIEKKYPSELIAIEKKIKLVEKTKRFDIVVYNANMLPNIIVECKNKNVPLQENVLQQIINYNNTIKANYLIITNGDSVMGWDLLQQKELKSIPEYAI